MDLQADISWTITHSESEGYHIGSRWYKGDILFVKNTITPYELSNARQPLREWWLGGPGLTDLWVLVSQQPFHRVWYEEWQAWAHEQGGGFEHYSLKQGAKILPLILKERMGSRILVRTQPCDQPEIWRPSTQDRSTILLSE